MAVESWREGTWHRISLVSGGDTLNKTVVSTAQPATTPKTTDWHFKMVNFYMSEIHPNFRKLK
jgi:hypothetical protein